MDIPQHLLNRLRGEYLEMPGMGLTAQQAQRLCGLERALCQAALDALVDARFLYLKTNGQYARVTEVASGPTTVKAVDSPRNGTSVNSEPLRDVG
jgi:hypothetical protein